LSESGKRRSSKLLALFQELLRSHSSFLHAYVILEAPQHAY
jgi:hypothetical protein